MSKKTLTYAAVFLTCLYCHSAQAEPSKPNVLFIMVDDLNDWVGALEGNTQAVTPRMDKLFERGTYFSNAHCSAPVCNTSLVIRS